MGSFIQRFWISDPKYPILRPDIRFQDRISEIADDPNLFYVLFLWKMQFLFFGYMIQSEFSDVLFFRIEFRLHFPLSKSFGYPEWTPLIFSNLFFPNSFILRYKLHLHFRIWVEFRFWIRINLSPLFGFWGFHLFLRGFDFGFIQWWKRRNSFS